MTWHNFIENWWPKVKSGLQREKTKRLLYLAIMSLSCVFIAIAIYANWHEFQAQELKINYSYIVLATLLYPLGMLPTAAAWHTLLQAFGIKKNFRTNLRVYSLSSLPRRIPGFVWFVTSRTLLYQDENVSPVMTVAATGAEIVLLALSGFIISILLTVPASGAFKQLPSIRLALPVAAVLLLIITAWTPNLNRLFKKILPPLGVQNIPQLNQRGIVRSLVWMFLAWSGGGVLLFILAHAIIPLKWSLLPITIGMWGAAGAVSLTVGIGIQGMGIREITLSALLSMIMSPLLAIVLAVLFRLVLTIGEFLWVLIFIRLTKKPS